MDAAPETTSPSRDSYDAIVIGGGPAGTTFARLLRAAGRSVLTLERARHPRFCIGESLLPCSFPLWHRLGLVERLEKAGFLRKYGAYFCSADGRSPELFRFAEADPGLPHAYEVPRAEFDRLLWEAALETGVEGLQDATVMRVALEGERAVGVEVQLADGARRMLSSRLVADCSGRATLLARQLGIRERDAQLDTLAIYRHYEGVFRSTGEDEGTIAIVATEFGWMWLIPFAGTAASVGAVMRREWYMQRRRLGLDRDALWSAILAEVPAVGARLAGAVAIRPLEVAADFQYRARSLAGEGWVLIGDAGGFLDPVFSSGVHLAMSGAALAAQDAIRALRGGRRPRQRDFRDYARRAGGAFDTFSRFIRAWYDPAFRRVFMRPPARRPGVAYLRREIVGVLAGDVFRPWRRRLAIEVLLLIAGLERRRGRDRASDSGLPPRQI